MYEQFYDAAFEAVSAWPDVDSDEFPELVRQQAILMSGHSDEFYLGTDAEIYPSTFR